jgi:hypothetical protein
MKRKIKKFTPTFKVEHFVGQSCGGELCGVCFRAGKKTPAAHKLGEEIPDDYPSQATHNLTQYVCCEHFKQVVGPGASVFRGCPTEEGARSDLNAATGS